jgi:cell division protein ZipA
MEEIRLALLVLGACAIAGILAHGLWSIRKNAEGKEKPSFQPREWDDEEYSNSEDDEQDPLVIEADMDDEPDFAINIEVDDSDTSDNEHSHSFDDLGLGPVRVVTAQNKPKASDSEDNQQKSTTGKAEAEAEDIKPIPAVPSPKIYSSVVSQPKPEYVAAQQAMQDRVTNKTEVKISDIPEPPPFLLKTEQPTINEPDFAHEPLDLRAPPGPADKKIVEPAAGLEKISLAEQARNLVKRRKVESPAKKRREPLMTQSKAREDQMRIDFDDVDDSGSGEQENSQANDGAPEQEVLILNVKAPDDKPIQGAALLPMLLTLGFKFGDQDIFHRHVNSNGKGPVLFSLANMFKPGVFDIDKLETFTTLGISLFMILPIEGDPHQVFNMMHNAARKIADEFSAQVVDARRSVLTKQSLQQYVEKIREFERKRLLR